MARPRTQSSNRWTVQNILRLLRRRVHRIQRKTTGRTTHGSQRDPYRSSWGLVERCRVAVCCVCTHGQETLNESRISKVVYACTIIVIWKCDWHTRKRMCSCVVLAIKGLVVTVISSGTTKSIAESWNKRCIWNHTMLCLYKTRENDSNINSQSQR